MNGSGGASGFALAAETTLLGIDVSEVAVDGDGLEVTLLLALTATDTCAEAGLAGDSTFVLVDTENDHSASLGSLLTQLDDVARASLDALAAGGTFLFVHYGQTRLGIHREGSELASCHAVTATETTERASRFADVEVVLDTARTYAVLLAGARACFARAVSAHYSHFWVGRNRCQTQDGSYFFHGGSTSHWAEQTV